MHYPWWHVPFLTSPMLIALVSVAHVLVSHYAVGGGLFLAVETRFAYRSGDRAYLAYLKSHAWFFILVTVVFGAISGVGIWWTIGLASPLATETLIHAFVFGWAMEYAFFLVEVVAAFVFYYWWGRLDEKSHQAVGWLYAFSAWMSLVIITGITGFMLNPGGWPESREFWTGFFNPQFAPQVVARTGGSFLLASLYVYLHAAFSVGVDDPALRNLIARRSARPALLGAVLIVTGGMGWYVFLPSSAKAALAAASVLNVLMVLLFTLTVAVFVLLYLGPYRNPRWLSPGFAIAFLAFGLAAVTTGEYVREAVRKPYVVYNVVMSNQVLAEEIPLLRQKGYLEGGTWTRAWVAERYPQMVNEGKIDEAALLKLPAADQEALGQVVFQYHCNQCHATTGGFSAIKHMTRGWSDDMLRIVAEYPDQMHFFMPPWAGTKEESELLVRYLKTLAEPSPAGMYFGRGR